MRRGYTLLEIVIYVAMLSVIAILAVSAILSIYRAFGKITAERRVALSGDVALETMIREIRAASGADLAVSIFNSHPGILKLNTNKTFSLSGTALQIQDGGGPAQNITSDARVTNLVFRRAVSTNSDLIKIEMTLEAGSGNYFKSRNFYGSAVMRKAY